jgi:pimeloyl-ACP methyl ester carboxylesterase
LIEVEPGVKLEVLDWGGVGEPVVLLAGHGDTGHIFDEFASQLADRFRVLAITRRGFGASSQPDHGYDLITLVRDIARVLDALDLKRVHLIGHSIAGDELTRFARTFADRVAKLVYLEAAYDRVKAREIQERFPKLPPLPEPRHGTPAEIRDFISRTEILMPEAEIRATRLFDSNEHYLHPVTPDWIVREVAGIAEHPDYQGVHSPMLALYAVYTDPAQLAPRYRFADSKTRQEIDDIFRMWTQFAEQQRKEFEKTVPTAQLIKVEGASHYLFLSNREEVVRRVRYFLESTDGRILDYSRQSKSD